MCRPEAGAAQSGEGRLQLVAFLLVQDDEMGHGRGGRGVASDEGPEHASDGDLARLWRPAVLVVVPLRFYFFEEVVEHLRDRRTALRRGQLGEASGVCERECSGFHLFHLPQVSQVTLVPYHQHAGRWPPLRQFLRRQEKERY